MMIKTAKDTDVVAGNGGLVGRHTHTHSVDVRIDKPRQEARAHKYKSTHGDIVT